jgi:protein NRD1
MNEMIPVIPENQKVCHRHLRSATDRPKEKLSKLLDIWSTGKTFPANMLADFKTRLLNPSAAIPAQPAKPAFSAPADTASLLAALAAPPPPAPAPAPVPHPQAAAGATQNANASTNALLAALGLGQPPQLLPSAAPMPFAPNGQNVAFPPQPPALPQNGAPMGLYNGNHAAAPPPASNPNPLLAMFASLQAAPQAGPADANALAAQISQLQALQALSQLGPDALKTLAAALSGGGLQPPPAPAVQPAPPAQQPQYGQMPQGNQPYGRENNFPDVRARSRSPDFNQRRSSPPKRRDSPTYGAYDPSAPSNDGPRGGDHERGRRGRRGGRNDFRQRTPPNNRDRDTDSLPRSHQPKPIGVDNKLPEGHIKGTFVSRLLDRVDHSSA